jgi:Family of unknown function (DUF6172)
MKKTFTLTHEKIKPARLAESARRDVHRYLKRSRKRELPEENNLWEFDCKFGLTEEAAEVVTEVELLKAMVEAEAKGVESFYVEILARAGNRPPKAAPSTPPPAEPAEETPPPSEPQPEE